jgi:hypothetical protein
MGYWFLKFEGTIVPSSLRVMESKEFFLDSLIIECFRHYSLSNFKSHYSSDEVLHSRRPECTHSLFIFALAHFCLRLALKSAFYISDYMEFSHNSYSWLKGVGCIS